MKSTIYTPHSRELSDPKKHLNLFILYYYNINDKTN
jgi:hypothetical protein